jgi:DNA-binding NarL/FixJ family response regulator
MVSTPVLTILWKLDVSDRTVAAIRVCRSTGRRLR